MLTKNVTLNWKIKQLARWGLSQRWITRSIPYLFVYQRVMRHKMLKNILRPDRVRLENTNVCEANCKFCPHDSMTRPKGYMPMDLFKYLVQQVKQWGVQELVIQGFGEPLADPQFLERVSYAWSAGIPKIQTNINSRFIDPKIIPHLLTCGLTELFISCNHWGEFNVRQLLQRRKGKFPRIYLSFIKGETKVYEGIKADGVSVSYPHNWGGVLPYVHAYDKDPCRLLWVTMYISWDGRVHLCCMDYDVKYKYGDASKSPLKWLWENQGYRKVHQRGNWDDLEICKGCSYNCHNKSPWWIS